VLAFVIGNVQVERVPPQPPDQRAKRQPLAGTALSRRGAWEVAADAHLPGQTISPPLLRTVPLPTRATESLNVAGAKRAVTVAARSIRSVHGVVPEHPPPQRTKRWPGAAVAVNPRTVPGFQSIAQVALQAGPGMSLSIVPPPDSWSVSRA
jgi:hypothetical protein